MLEKPHAEDHLAGLKPFQRSAVDYIFERLYGPDSEQRRFLIADEVGLGKTIVAKGLIARAAEYLWDKVGTVDIVYICSNQNIASQNIHRLNITGRKSVAVPARLTLLPILIPKLSENKLNLVSLTPGTSFNLASRGGQAFERAVLYYMLRDVWEIGSSKRYVNLLSCRKGHGPWRSLLEDVGRQLDDGTRELNQEMVDSFGAALEQKRERERQAGKKDLRTRFEEAAEVFGRKRSERPWAHRNLQYGIVGELRKIVAQASIDYLTPDLIILDEFQRFKKLLDGDDAVSKLAHKLFDYSGSTHEQEEARVVMLSATPYKMYTMHHEVADDDHYEDFLRTIEFLFGEDKARIEWFRSLLKRYRTLLTGRNKEQREQELSRVKEAIETALNEVMVRTERFAEIHDPDGMIREDIGQARLLPEDVEEYASVHQLGEHVGTRNLMEYWKSAPYLPSFMGQNYQLKRQLIETLDDTEENATLRQQLSQMSFKADEIQRYESVELRNAKLRHLLELSLEGPQSWRLLWVPPSLPYWEPQDAYADPAARDFTKTLVFSSWKMVPKVISMLVSYEAERQMVGKSGYGYDELTEKINPLLIFGTTHDEPDHMASMSLFYPCLWMARNLDPADIAKSAGGGDTPSYQEVFEETRRRLSRALQGAGVSVQKSREGRQEVQFWKYMVALDGQISTEDEVSPSLRWLTIDVPEIRWQDMVGGSDAGRGFARHAERLTEAFEQPVPEVITDDELDQLTELSLNAPATASLRSLLRLCTDPTTNDVVVAMAHAARIAMGFRSRFNQPWVIEMLRSPRTDVPYWWSVVEHCRAGNLQALLDEYLHVLRDSEGLTAQHNQSTTGHLSAHLQSTLSIRPASPSFDSFSAEGAEATSTHKMRTHFALRLGDDNEVVDPDSSFRGDVVRRAFNSPFHPFVLATTSIGQEGLDFHLNCHRVFHWNLPSNPVDLEQREGRINRYKGHLIRRNVADDFGLTHISGTQEADLWDELFDLAEEQTRQQTCGLQPNWIYEREEGYRLIRVVPSVPYSREIGQLDDLKRSLLFYRMVFGQPRQQDLVEFLMKRYGDLSAEELDQKVREFWIDLSPPELCGANSTNSGVWSDNSSCS